MNSKDEKWAIFWCNLLRPIIFEEIDNAEINQYLKSLSKHEHLFPDGKQERVSVSTLRRKLNQYIQGGFKNLSRKVRIDKGKIRTASQEIIDKAIELKKDQPMRGDDTINRFLSVYYGKTIPKSTLYRHLKNAGATKIKLGITKKKVRKRWSRNHTHDLWVGDFEDGPYVLVDGEVLPTYLSLFIDCHSRYIVEGRYYLRENLDILIDSLLRAWAVHGSSKELYVDNAKVYHSNRLKAACYALHIKLLHRPPRDAAAGGLVEKAFGTIQSQFEPEVRAGDILMFDKLNRAFSAYLSVAYHQRIHSEIKQPPKQHYDEGLTVIRHVDMSEAIKFFMKKDKRTVHKDFSDVRIDNRFYRVDSKLRGDKVEVRYDPFSDMQKVFLYSLNKEDVYLGQGILYNRDYGEDINDSSEKPKPQHSYIDLLISEHDKQLNAQIKGIDYTKMHTQRAWPFVAFAQKLARLMGRKGKLSAFTSDELEALKKIYNRIADLDEAMLLKAWEESSHKTLTHVIYQLQIIKLQKED
ncbi:MAG: transposase [Gammaproteobacteria bacterium]|nr:transposase [Gammaproteobacteria bacterium]